MFRFIQTDRRGFTLIELLVVIAIIAILSSTVLASLRTARSKARDARRMSDVRQLRSALELYYDKNGSYPSTAGAYQIVTPSNVVLQALVTQGFMPALPKDPESIGSGITEIYYGSPGWWSTAWEYQIQFALENQNTGAGICAVGTCPFPPSNRWVYSIHP